MFWRCFWITVALVLHTSLSYVGEAQTLTSSEAIIREASARVDVGAYAEAISILTDLSNSSPLPLEALRRIDMIRAEALLGQGKLEAALVPARRAVEGAAEGNSGAMGGSRLLLARDARPKHGAGATAKEPPHGLEGGRPACRAARTRT